jgi:hypothetical protein
MGNCFGNVEWERIEWAGVIAQGCDHALKEELMNRFKSDQSRETIPGNKDTVSILSHFHANTRGGSTAMPSDDVDVPLGKRPQER